MGLCYYRDGFMYEKMYAVNFEKLFNNYIRENYFVNLVSQIYVIGKFVFKFILLSFYCIFFVDEFLIYLQF